MGTKNNPGNFDYYARAVFFPPYAGYLVVERVMQAYGVF